MRAGTEQTRRGGAISQWMDSAAMPMREIRLRTVRRNEEARWNKLLRAHHDLGFRSLRGRRLRHVAVLGLRAQAKTSLSFRAFGSRWSEPSGRAVLAAHLVPLCVDQSWTNRATGRSAQGYWPQDKCLPRFTAALHTCQHARRIPAGEARMRHPQSTVGTGAATLTRAAGRPKLPAQPPLRSHPSQGSTPRP